ncbi:DegV family protein [Chloroflexota bacterium]
MSHKVKIVTDSSAYLILDTLKYIWKGERIGKAKALLDSLLTIKPIVVLKNGEIRS